MDKSTAEFLLQCARAADDSYKPMEELTSLSSARECVTSDGGIDRSILGSIVHKGKTMVVVAIRGTKEVQNWIQNIDISLTDVQPMFVDTCSQKNDLKVHRGFQGALHSLYNHGLYAQLESLHDNIHPTAREKSVVLVGHSKGGALAVQLAYHLLQKNWAVTLVTFGAPATANEHMVSYLNSRVLSAEGEGRVVMNYRVVNSLDAVPHSLEQTKTALEEEPKSYHHFGEAVTLDNHIDAVSNIVRNGATNLKGLFQKSDSKEKLTPTQTIFNALGNFGKEVVDHHLLTQYILNLEKFC